MSTITPTALDARLSNGERVIRVLGTLAYAADVDRMDPEPCADLWPDLTSSDALKILRAAKRSGNESEWIEDFVAAVRWNRKNGQ